MLGWNSWNKLKFVAKFQMTGKFFDTLIIQQNNKLLVFVNFYLKFEMCNFYYSRNPMSIPILIVFITIFWPVCLPAFLTETPGWVINFILGDKWTNIIIDIRTIYLFFCFLINVFWASKISADNSNQWNWKITVIRKKNTKIKMVILETCRIIWNFCIFKLEPKKIFFCFNFWNKELWFTN